MGGGSSKNFVPNLLIPGQSAAILATASELGYSTRDVDGMFRSFARLDADGGGLVSIDEFITVNKLSNERFAKLAFSLFDEDRSGAMNFEEYLIGCWSLLSMDEESLATFAFQLFDEDDSGELSALELQEVGDIACGNDKVSNDRMKKEFKRMDKNHDGTVTLDEFIRLVKEVPILLLPAFEMRDTLRTSTIGGGRWKELGKDRKNKYKDLHIEDILANLKVKPTCYVLKKVNFNQYQGNQRSVVAMECYRKRNRRESKTSIKKEPKEKKEKIAHVSERKNSVGSHLQKKATNYR